MSKGINSVTLIGNLGKDPEIRYTSDGKAITNLSLATAESWKDKQTGERVERTEWHQLIFFGKLAEIAEKYLTKGAKIYTTGKLKTETWKDKATGENRYAVKIICNELLMLDSNTKTNDVPV